jgi:hypothetical protein
MIWHRFIDGQLRMGCYYNPRKSQAILISNSNVGMALPCLFLSAEEIPWCDVVTDLGVVIDGRLTYGRQVTRVCSKVYATLYNMRLLNLLTSLFFLL